MSAPPTTAVPVYMTEWHTQFMNESEVDPAHFADTMQLINPGIDLKRSLVSIVNKRMDLNPYTSVVSYDPAADTEALTTANSTFREEAETIDPVPKWRLYTDAAGDQYNDDIASLSFEDTIEARYREGLKRLQIETARFAAGAADINAVHCDAFVRGIAMMEGDLLASLKDEELRLDLIDKQLKLDYIRAAVAAMIGLLGSRINSIQVATGQDHDAVKTIITAKSNYYAQEQDIMVNEAKWELDSFGEIGAFMGAINGAPRLTYVKQTPKQEFLANSLTTAAMMGSAGMQIGGPVGGAVGMLGGIIAAGAYQAAGR